MDLEQTSILIIVAFASFLLGNHLGASNQPRKSGDCLDEFLKETKRLSKGESLCLKIEIDRYGDDDLEGGNHRRFGFYPDFNPSENN